MLIAYCPCCYTYEPREYRCIIVGREGMSFYATNRDFSKYYFLRHNGYDLCPYSKCSWKVLGLLIVTDVYSVGVRANGSVL